jgi:hypothetical protein
MYLRTVLNPQITNKIGSANRKSAKCHICGRSANITNYLSPQICGFAEFTVFADRPPLVTFLRILERWSSIATLVENNLSIHYYITLL